MTQSPEKYGIIRRRRWSRSSVSLLTSVTARQSTERIGTSGHLKSRGSLGVKPLRIAFVSAYPPSTGPLSEYAWHLVEVLRRHPRVEAVFVLADRAAGAATRSDGKLQVLPCWSFDGLTTPISVTRAIRHLQVDLVWFNLHLTSTGNRRSSQFIGLSAPAVARLAGVPTVVTLHNMLGLTDLSLTGMKLMPLDVWAGHAATGLLRAADLVCVLRPEYAELLRTRYGIRHVRYMPHGTLGTPVATVLPRDGRDILAFGHFGGYKRLEQVVEAVAALAAGGANIHLWVGGTDSRYNLGYLDRLRRAHSGAPYLTFLGYVPESEVASLFQRATLSVLPYATMTGMSGVAIQSAMYGVPVVASNIAAFRSLAAEGLRMSFFEWLNTQSLADTIRGLLQSAEVRQQQAVHNLRYCQAQRMEGVVDTYVDLISELVSTARRHKALSVSAP